MQTFLMWRCGEDESGDRGKSDRVVRRLDQYCRTFFTESPKVTAIHQANCAIVYLELPVKGWNPPYFQQDDLDWALSLDYPVDADLALKAAGRKIRQEPNCLPEFGRALNDDPFRVLERTSPPFVLIWGKRGGEKVYVQNDGLGFGQVFEYDNGTQWALTNRTYALKALGIELKPSPVQWATKCALGWFPQEMTGFEDLNALKPGTQLEIDARQIKRSHHDVLRRWITPDEMPIDDCLELASTSVLNHLKAASRLWSHAAAGLTGGMDSRSVVSTIIKGDIPLDYVRTHGLPSNKDILIARHLAKLAGLPHRLETKRALPVPTSSQLRKCVELALRWQCGQMEIKAHKTFSRKGISPIGGRVNIMGKHGEIGRGYYHQRLNGQAETPGEWQDRLLQYLMSRSMPLLRTEMKDAVSEIVLQAIRHADRYGLAGYDQIDFFYLYERTRRWASGTVYFQAGKVITPFLNPDYIRAVYSLPGKLRSTHPCQMHIVSNNMPIWRDIPYLSQSAMKRWCRKRTTRLQACGWGLRNLMAMIQNPRLIRYHNPIGRRHAYDNTRYWKSVGRTLIDESLSRGELINTIFDGDKLRDRLPPDPDILAILYLLEEIL